MASANYAGGHVALGRRALGRARPCLFCGRIVREYKPHERNIPRHNCPHGKKCARGTGIPQVAWDGGEFFTGPPKVCAECVEARRVAA